MTTSIGIIGYGEAGRAIGAGLRASGADVTAYDILFPVPDGAQIRQAAAVDGVVACNDSAAALGNRQIVLSLVHAGAARDAAQDAARHLTGGQIFVDMNSVSPREKKMGAALVAASGATYVEATIMAPITSAGVATEVLLAGPQAGAAQSILTPLGMNVDVVSDQYGAAATVKLCRSVVIKGMEAILIESMLAAHRFGADRAVLASLQKSDPEIDWTAKSSYVFERVLQHGRRRAAEMRFAGQAVADAGYPPLMSEAIAALQDQVADLADAEPVLAASEDYSAAARRIEAMLETTIDLNDSQSEEEQ